ncbi:MAG: tetratricopeptide repeat protein [Planctomycetia bacterium]|nr:tetratricopeptide repeat protein [Planctomycetia bacterium]
MRPSRVRHSKGAVVRQADSVGEKSGRLVIVALGLVIVILAAGLWAWRRRAGEYKSDSFQLPEGIWKGVVNDSTGGEFAARESSDSERAYDEFEKGARRAASDVIRLFPDDALAYAVKAQVETGLGDTTAALRTWKMGLELTPSNGEPYFGIGQILTERGDYAKAEAFVRIGLAKQPGSPLGSTLLANAFLHQGKLNDVILFLEDAADANLAPVPCLLILGQAFIGVHAYGKAETCFHSATVLAPEDPSAWYGLATACMRLGKQTEAEKHLQRFKQLEASVGNAGDEHAAGEVDVLRERVASGHQRIAEFYATRELWKATEEQLLLAARAGTNDVRCRTQLVSLYVKLGETEKASRMCEQLIDVDSPNAIEYLLKQGSLWTHVGDFDRAEKAYQRACDLSPNDARGFAELAELYAHLGRAAEARDAIEQAISRDPQNEHYQRTLIRFSEAR